ncbi:auxin-responsive protein SAUR36-like [Panicum miliaceum]|uniref:Auxin-responsive protein SAUR36-like n=1 Tax=Panicum miliaceum TaxID=4540 RepID=A0A3L6T9C0_PANMI|nr:auxin-responsive protein SAUR36-like [Panicum miliaceum]
MMKANRIAQLARKWQRMAALRLSLGVAVEADECCTSVASKGHCMVYTADKRRFEVPLAYLSTPAIAELLRISQEEFGFVSDGRISLPCDAAVMEYDMCLLRRGFFVELEKAFLNTMECVDNQASLNHFNCIEDWCPANAQANCASMSSGLARSTLRYGTAQPAAETKAFVDMV